MWRAIASNALTLLALILFLIGGMVLWGRGQYSGPGPLASAICLQVDRGSTMARVSRDLEGQGAISSGSIFRMGADYADKARQLKAGSFLIEPGASMAEIVDTVTRGGASTCGTEIVYRIGVNRLSVQVREMDPSTNRFAERASYVAGRDPVPAIYNEVKQGQDTRFRVAFAEGVTSWQVVDSLKNMDVLEGAVAEIPPEGALAPDSYEVRPGDDRTNVIARMTEAQIDRVSRVWAARNPEVPLPTPEALITLASIVEKETGVASERGQVASVFVNRLNRGMKLQTDPTVIYGITKGQGVLGRGLRRSELRAATPWNTYVIDGLPPTPIANPGLASLEAAANPPTTDYIFFVADGTGGHEFTTNLQDHNRAVARWRRIEAERANSDNN